MRINQQLARTYPRGLISGDFVAHLIAHLVEIHLFSVKCSTKCASKYQRLSAAFLILALTGCAVGPNYHTPTTSVPAQFANGTQTNLSPAETLVTWWRGFNDPMLDRLVSVALTNNHDLRIAKANLREARALHRYSQFDLLPVINATAGYTRTRTSQAAAPFLPSNLLETDLYDAGFDATWELDVFGHVRRSIEASSAEVEAAEANQRDVEVTLISEVARNYFELRGAQNELAVARGNAENQRQTLGITQARLEGGRGTELDVARARAQWSATLAIIPPLETAIAESIHRLGVLTGQQPTALQPDLEPAVPLPPLPALVNISTPEELLRRRADVRVAERRLAAATARIGVATADLFPRVTFNGNVALQATSIGELGNAGNDAYSFGPRITWAALDYGHVRARIQAAGARAEAALAFYERTVLTTLEETENALVDFGRERTRHDYLRDSVQSSEVAAFLARQRYEAGAADFLTVLDAERALLIARDQFAQSQTRTATALVAVYKALGGGWETVAPEQASIGAYP
jgi:multidrug efflux system outer membrane protein